MIICFSLSSDATYFLVRYRRDRNLFTHRRAILKILIGVTAMTNVLVIDATPENCGRDAAANIFFDIAAILKCIW